LKAFSIAFLIASAIFIAGCADPLEKPVVQDVPEKFQRGITGQGTLGPMDRTDDQYIKQTHP
jgi:PBP1b-binding outer membrane lipoprotein LpoB